MKNASIRILVLMAVITLIGTVSTQMYWIKLAIDQQDQVFNQNVHVALRNVVESLCEARGKDYPTVDPIEQVSPSYFVVRTNDQININDLEYLITAEIKQRAISQDFDYGVYNCQNDKMVFAKNVSLEQQSAAGQLPNLENQDYYFGVYFPNKSQELIAGLDIWKFTSGLTVLVLIFFGYALFVILRQKRLSEMQRDFVNNVTHELKTPLTTLSLAASSMEGKSQETQAKYIRIIQSETEKLQLNVSEILQASMIETRQPVAKENVSLRSFLISLLHDLKMQYAACMISWELSGQAQANLSTDKKVLETAIRNLVDNAVKYGGKKIHISFNQAQNKTQIVVSDDGKGVPKKYLPYLFKKFYRVPDVGHQHNVAGFGLGLYLIKKSLKRVGAKITVISEENSGCTFTITIPNG